MKTPIALPSLLLLPCLLLQPRLARISKTEAGPEAATSTLTRAEVVADLQAAQQNGSMPNYDFTYVSPQKQQATVVTREQVKAETLAAMKNGGLSLGS